MRRRAVGGRWLLPTLLPVAVLAGLLVARHPRTVYTSDSTAQQSIVRTWLDVGHGLTYVPPDTWWMKIPVYLVLENLPLAPIHKLLAAVLVLNIVTFLLLGLAMRMLAPDARWYELVAPLLWLAALGGGIGSNRMLPNYRNIELGLIFVVLALVARYLGGVAPADRAGSRRLAKGFGAAILLALFWVDDPYFGILVAGPLAVGAVVWFWLRAPVGQPRDRRLLRLSGVLLLSLVLTVPVHALARLAGVHIGDSGKTVAQSLGAVWDHVLLLPPGVGIQLGVDRWDLGPLHDVAQILLLASLFAMLAASTALALHGWVNRLLVPFFIGAHWPLVIGAYLVSWYAQDIRTSRYLVLIVYDVAIASVMLLPILRRSRSESPGETRSGSAGGPGGESAGGSGHARLAYRFAVLLALAAVLGTASGARTAIDADRRPSAALEAQQQVQRAIGEAAAAGTLKGYAPFWSANINSYLTGDRVTAAEVVCSNRHLASRQWLSDTARLHRRATSSFLIWVPDAVNLSGCDAGIRDAQLGAPQRSIDGGNGTQVLVYPYDIAGRLGPSVTPR